MAAMMMNLPVALCQRLLALHPRQRCLALHLQPRGPCAALHRLSHADRIFIRAFWSIPFAPTCYHNAVSNSDLVLKLKPLKGDVCNGNVSHSP